MSDDDATQVDMPALESSYDVAGPTLQDQPSPFRANVGSVKPTTPGMPPAVRFDAEVTVKAPIPSEETVLTPPSIEAPELDSATTQPDGIPVMPRPDGKLVFDDGLTVRQEGVPVLPRRQGRVPGPDEPLVQVSKSMEMKIADLDEQAPPSPRRRAAAAPTEVMLPALKAKEEAQKEGSDAPLLILLAVIVVVILALAGLVVWGLMRSL